MSFLYFVNDFIVFAVVDSVHLAAINTVSRFLDIFANVQRLVHLFSHLE